MLILTWDPDPSAPFCGVIGVDSGVGALSVVVRGRFAAGATVTSPLGDDEDEEGGDLLVPLLPTARLLTSVPRFLKRDVKICKLFCWNFYETGHSGLEGGG